MTTLVEYVHPRSSLLFRIGWAKLLYQLSPVSSIFNSNLLNETNYKSEYKDAASSRIIISRTHLVSQPIVFRFVVRFVCCNC